MLDLKIDLSTNLEIFCFERNSTFNIDPNKVYLPKDRLNAGFDSLIFVNNNNKNKKKKQKTKESYLALVFQNKISEVDKTTKLKYTEVMESIRKSKNNLNNKINSIDNFEIIPVFIFLCMRDIQPKLLKENKSKNKPINKAKNKPTNKSENDLGDELGDGLRVDINSKFEDNIMILDESDLEKLYGINLFQIPNYLRTGALFKQVGFQKIKSQV